MNRFHAATRLFPSGGAELRRIFGRTVLPLLAAAVLGGCIFFPESYIEPAEFDLTAPEGAAAAEKLPRPVVFGVFRNLSGSDRRFLVRLGGEKLQSDEYNRWLLIPEQLVMRRLGEALSPQPEQGEPVRIDAEILRFEFDRSRNEAFFSARFTVRSGESTLFVDAAERTTLADSGPEAAAAAMSRSVDRAAAKLRAAVIPGSGTK